MMTGLIHNLTKHVETILRYKHFSDHYKLGHYSYRVMRKELPNGTYIKSGVYVISHYTPVSNSMVIFDTNEKSVLISVPNVYELLFKEDGIHHNGRIYQYYIPEEDIIEMNLKGIFVPDNYHLVLNSKMKKVFKELDKWT